MNVNTKKLEGVFFADLVYCGLSPAIIEGPVYFMPPNIYWMLTSFSVPKKTKKTNPDSAFPHAGVVYSGEVLPGPSDSLLQCSDSNN